MHEYHLPQQRMVLSRVEPSRLLPLLPDLCVRTKAKTQIKKSVSKID
jgi:hypothetical protein